MHVKLLLALAPDGTGWVATASTGIVHRGRSLKGVRAKALDSLNRHYGSELHLEEEILWPPDYLAAVEAARVAKNLAEEAERERDECRRTLMLKLMKMNLGGVLLSGLREVAEHVGASEARLLEALNLPMDFFAGVEPSSNKTHLVVTPLLQDEKEQVQLCQGRALELAKGAARKQYERDLLAWKIHIEPHPSTLTREIFVGTLPECLTVRGRGTQDGDPSKRPD